MLHSADRAQPHGTEYLGGTIEGRPGGACLIDQELWRRPLCMAHAAMHASDDAHPPGRVLQHVLMQQMLPTATQL